MILSCNSLILASAIDLRDRMAPIGRSTSMVFRDTTIIIGIGILLLVLLMAWAKYLRRRKKKRHHSSSGRQLIREVVHVSEQPVDDDDDDEGDGDGDEGEDSDGGSQTLRRKFKYRARRRAHRTRNPTLAETGGLPPARPDDPKRGTA